MKIEPGQVAVVTGAANGIGFALCRTLAARGCHIALVDIDEENLASRVAELGRNHIRVSHHALDVGDRTAAAQLPQEVLGVHDRVNLLVNNAGVMVSSPLEELDLADFDWLLNTNFWGTLHMCKYFLPALKASGDAHIVNVLSNFGLIGFPNKTPYCSSKFALRGFTEALRAELYPDRIRVSEFYPPAVDTSIIEKSRTWDEEKKQIEVQYWKDRAVPMEKVIRTLVRGIERDKPRILSGRDTVFLDAIKRVLPATTNRLLNLYRNCLLFI